MITLYLSCTWKATALVLALRSLSLYLHLTWISLFLRPLKQSQVFQGQSGCSREVHAQTTVLQQNISASFHTKAVRFTQVLLVLQSSHTKHNLDPCFHSFCLQRKSWKCGVTVTNTAISAWVSKQPDIVCLLSAPIYPKARRHIDI